MPKLPYGLRLREIVLALAVGGLGSGAALVMLEVMDDAEAHDEPAAYAAGPSEATYELAAFDEVITSGPQDVEITIGETFSVRSEGPPEALSLLEPVVENGRLTIGPRDGFNWNRWSRLDGATFHVTVPRLDSVTTAGSGDVRIDRVEGESFEVNIGGPGEITIGELDVGEAGFTVAGSGNLVVAGSARETRVTIAGSGEVQAGGMQSETANIQIGGSGDVVLGVEREARISITGSGDVTILGDAECSVTRMGSGDVRCGGVLQDAN